MRTRTVVWGFAVVAAAVFIVVLIGQRPGPALRGMEVPEGYKAYLDTRDFCAKAELLSTEHLQEGIVRWKIEVRVLDSSNKAVRGSRVELYSLRTPPERRPGAIVLAYGEKTASDGGRLWGNVLPVVTGTDGRMRVILEESAGK